MPVASSGTCWRVEPPLRRAVLGEHEAEDDQRSSRSESPRATELPPMLLLKPLLYPPLPPTALAPTATPDAVLPGVASLVLRKRWRRGEDVGVRVGVERTTVAVAASGVGEEVCSAGARRRPGLPCRRMAAATRADGESTNTRICVAK